MVPVHGILASTSIALNDCWRKWTNEQTQPYPGWDGTVNCRILEIDAHRKLSYTWVVGDNLQLDTVVTFTLAPTASGTRLSLVQSGFKPDQKQNFGGARYGWKMMGEKLIGMLARIP